MYVYIYVHVQVMIDTVIVHSSRLYTWHLFCYSNYTMLGVLVLSFQYYWYTCNILHLLTKKKEKKNIKVVILVYMLFVKYNVV